MVVDLMSCLLFTLAGLAEGVMWHLQFHYSANGPFKNRQFWDPSISWKNKWRVGYEHWAETVYVGQERFFMSSRWLVWLTDGFHLMQFIRTVCITAGLVCVTGSFIIGVGLMVLFKLSFTLAMDALK